MSISDQLWGRIAKLAADLFSHSGHFPLHFARGKLQRDFLFRDVLAFLIKIRSEKQLKLLDLGCGQGLMEAVLMAYQNLAMQEGGGESSPILPLSLVKAYDLMPANVLWANKMLANSRHKPFDVAIEQGDICKLVLDRSDVLCLFDVLHYINFSAQEALLKQVYASLAVQGHLILRVGDAACSRQRCAGWVDQWMLLLRGYGWQPLWVRSQQAWEDLLAELGFEVLTTKKYSSLSRANTLIFCKKPDTGSGHLVEKSFIPVC